MDNYIDESTIDNQEALEELIWAIEASEGRFYIMLARCNYAYLQDRLIQQVQDQCVLDIRVIHLKQSDRTLYSTICAQLGQEMPDALMVSGLATVDNLDDMLRATNQVREEFRKNFHFPVILWINDAVHVKFLRIAPDFESWTTTTRFAIPTNELTEVLQETFESLLATALAVNSSQSLYNLSDVLDQGCLSRSEVDLALKELPHRVQDLDPQLEAGLQFIRGLNAGDSPEALEYFQQSLTFWQQVGAGLTDDLSDQTDNLTKLAPIDPKVGELDNEIQSTPINSKLKAGLVLFHIGLYHYRTTDRQKHQAVNWQKSKIYLQHGIDLFEQENRPDLVAKCITQLERVLQRMQAWDELEQVAQKALPLHQQYGSTSKLVQDYSFLAEVALQQQRWEDARQAAQQAEDIITQLPKPKRWIQGLNLLFLAQAERQLGNKQAAIFHLVKARELGDFRHPLISVRILEELRELYFEERQYLAAFATKKQRRSIEQQYGIRAFIGAGRLQPHREDASYWSRDLENLSPARREALGSFSLKNQQEASVKTDNQESVAPEIIASGRQRDLERLLERIGRNDCKLIVIHGRSGVGKSSLVNAGLVPALKHRVIGTQKNVPISIRVYTNWIEELEKQLLNDDEPVGAGLDDNLSGKPITAQQNPPNSSDLEDNCPEKPTTSPPNPPYFQILEQLRQDEQRQRRTVLIFDQFEEFFFVYTNAAERRQFWQFLADCLNILSVKVILSLREDYLHYLLECNRLDSMSVIGHDILGKNVLYELGNFSPTDARAIIEDLTTRSRFYLEPALIDQLVKDLAGKTGEILPIELQVVGAQLQAENIKTLTEYRELGTKEELVKRYLEEVVEDCGAENQQAAELVLYLLTDEKGTRPLKTRAELERDLEGLAADLTREAGKLDLVLRIFVDSGLVFLLPETPYDRYQLVHDYLAEFIRKQQESRLNELIAELEKEREQRQKAEALNRLAQEELERTEKSKKVLALANQQAKRRIQMGSAILGLTLVAAVVIWIWSETKVSTAQLQVEQAEQQVKDADIRVKEANSREIQAEQKVKTVEKKVSNSQKRAREANQKVEEAKKRLTVANRELNNARLREAKARQNLDAVKAEQNRVAQEAQQKIQVAERKIQDAEKRLITAQTKRQQAEVQARDAQTQFEQAQIAVAEAKTQLELADSARKEAIIGTKLEQEGARALLQFQSGQQLEGLLSAIQSGKELKALLNDKRPIQDYPASSPLLALQSILANIYERNRFNGYQDGVWGVSLSPDGKYIATGGEDGTVHIWNLAGQKIAKLDAHQREVMSVSFSPDGQRLATSGKDGNAKLWNLSGQQIAQFDGHKGSVIWVQFSPDGQRIATTGGDNTVRLWDLSGEQIALFDTNQQGVWDVNFSPNGQYLATTGFDGTVKLLNLSGQIIAEMKGHQGIVRSVSFSPDGQYLATAGDDDTVQVRKLSGQQINIVNKFKGNQNGIWDVSFSPDGKRLATAGLDGTIKVWQPFARFAQPTAEIQGHQGIAYHAIFSLDGQYLVTASEDEISKIWDISSHYFSQFITSQVKINNIIFSPDYKHIATVGADGTVKIWTLSGKQVTQLEPKLSNTETDENGTQLRFIPYSRYLMSVDFSPEANRLATGGEDGLIRLWNLSGQQLTEFRSHQEVVRSVSFSPNGKRLATVGKDGSVFLWNLSGQKLAEFKGHSEAFLSVSFSPDGQHLATVGEEGSVFLWNLSGQKLAEFKGHSGAVLSVSFSPDGKQLATAGEDQTARLWDLSGKQIAPLKGHQEAVLSVKYSPDGQRLVTAGEDGIARLWDLSGRQIGQIDVYQRVYSRGVYENVSLSVSFSPDGKLLATAGEYSTVKLWRMEGLEELLERGCDWLRFYLNNPSANLNESDRRICDGINSNS
ncbi:MAG: AAA family ATPase [Coleofasciculus sp. B1-GNL1-01]|uniref:WD40 domain-containing protein n=1 Tax=Coleofasciculus sp. B1-GNL1-01 TaxID=3068484 RepID=UPI0032F7455C